MQPPYCICASSLFFKQTSYSCRHADECARIATHIPHGMVQYTAGPAQLLPKNLQLAQQVAQAQAQAIARAQGRSASGSAISAETNAHAYAGQPHVYGMMPPQYPVSHMMHHMMGGMYGMPAAVQYPHAAAVLPLLVTQANMAILPICRGSGIGQAACKGLRRPRFCIRRAFPTKEKWALLPPNSKEDQG